jgi:ABC-type transport system involved in cytochrome c biogenesis permease subunit
MLISGKQTYKDEKGDTQPAVKWVLDVICHNESAVRQKVFRIENDQVLALLGLPPRSETSFRYALDEFAGKTDQLIVKAKAANAVPKAERDLFQVKVLELFGHLQLYQELAEGSQPLLLPPDEPGENWRTLRSAVVREKQAAKIQPNARDLDPALSSLKVILGSYVAHEPKAFNKAVADYRLQLDREYPVETRHTDLELFYNHFAPFYQCAVLYVFVFILSCLSWFGMSDALNRSAFWLAILTLVVHTWALIARMYLMDRWFVFVTNLYSSAVFIGWGCVVLCLVLEWLFRNGVGNLIAAVLGSLTMLIGHHLAASGDTLEMMQAVLDTNFWLATHVTCVTLGYVATFVAGFLGLVYVIRGVATPSLDRGLAKSLGQMIYGVVCFATLLSFTGTVLGGIWADQSWGRFWGWDPKENGALLIVIWNALILHARWGGMVKQRGMAVLAIVGNMVTGWSWFGTNQLGVGLHAYGFNNTLAAGLVIFWGFQLAAIIMGMLPLRWWVSYEALQTTKPVSSDPPPPHADKTNGKRRGKRSRRGDAGFFPGPA